MIEEHIKKWQDDFNQFLEKNYPDISRLYNERILFTPDKDNVIHPHLLQLSEAYASKDQIQKMNDVFNDYLTTHPI